MIEEPALTAIWKVPTVIIASRVLILKSTMIRYYYPSFVFEKTQEGKQSSWGCIAWQDMN